MPLVNIRELLGEFIGSKLLDITQQDDDELAEGEAYVMLMFDNNRAIKIDVSDIYGTFKADDDSD